MLCVFIGPKPYLASWRLRQVVSLRVVHTWMCRWVHVKCHGSLVYTFTLSFIIGIQEKLSTSHNPKVVARYYLEIIEQIGGIYCLFLLQLHMYTITPNKFTGCPSVVRADYGTENTCIAKAHIAFRMYHSDSLAGSKSFLYGSSTANIVSLCINSTLSLNGYVQRIEAWWSQLWRFKTGWWIDLFKVW